MDIKLKNIKYSLGTKAAAVILIWLCFLGAMGSLAFLLFNNEIVKSSSYYDTHGFKNQFGYLVYDTVLANVKLKSADNIKASSASDTEKTDKIQNLYSIRDKLAGMVNYKYYIKDMATGEVITNLAASNPVKQIKEQPANVYYNQISSISNMSSYNSGIGEMLMGTGYEVYAAIMEPLKPGDLFYDDSTYYWKIKTMSYYAYALLAVSLVLLTVAAVYLACVAGRKEKGGDIVLHPVDRIYTDVHTLLVLIAALLSVTISVRISGPSEIFSWIITFIVLSADAFIGISYVLSMIRQSKAGQLFSNTLIVVLYRKCKEFAKLCFDGQLFRPSALLLLLGYGIINGILFDLGVDIREGFQIPIFTVLFLAFNAAAVYYSAKSLSSLSQIMTAAKEISSGNLDYNLNNSEISIAFSGFAEDMGNIQGGLKKAVVEAVKGERMKTDLITNVSHDLKTPLTSIVNYVDLLKKEDLNNQKADEYVGILEEKSARLKQLIEDLVEASKASSGNLNVNAGKVDLHELVMQACGEYEEKLKKAELDIRISSEEKNTYIYADGKYMWRIVENLLSNVLKYSMPRSRVYVNLAKDDGYGSLTIKNISAFPLNIAPEQLTERFVRGDASRTTEGSGLGLSIAQSLAKLQGGRFRIEIDGDLFKVIVEIPLWEE